MIYQYNDLPFFCSRIGTIFKWRGNNKI